MTEREVGMTADEVKRVLGLVPHPREGGWFRRTFEAEDWVEGDRSADAPRRAGTAIYYLLARGEFSEMHRLKGDEVFHFYAGEAVEQVQLFADGSGRRVVMGTDLAAGERPQVVVGRGVWQGARLAPSAKEGGVGWALLGCTVCPGFEFEDYEAGVAEDLASEWPAWEREIRELCR